MQSLWTYCSPDLLHTCCPGISVYHTPRNLPVFTLLISYYLNLRFLSSYIPLSGLCTPPRSFLRNSPQEVILSRFHMSEKAFLLPHTWWISGWRLGNYQAFPWGVPLGHHQLLQPCIPHWAPSQQPSCHSLSTSSKLCERAFALTVSFSAWPFPRWSHGSLSHVIHSCAGRSPLTSLAFLCLIILYKMWPSSPHLCSSSFAIPFYLEITHTHTHTFTPLRLITTCHCTG